MNIELQTKIFQLRSVLNSISDASFAYKTLYNKYRLDSLDEETGKQLLKAYQTIIEQVKNSIQNTENGTEKYSST